MSSEPHSGCQEVLSALRGRRTSLRQLGGGSQAPPAGVQRPRRRAGNSPPRRPRPETAMNAGEVFLEPSGESVNWLEIGGRRRPPAVSPIGRSREPTRSRGWPGTSPVSRTSISPMPPASSRPGSRKAGTRRFGMEPDPHNTGRGHGPDEVAAIPADPGLLLALSTRRSPSGPRRIWPPSMRLNWTESSIAPSTPRSRSASPGERHQRQRAACRPGALPPRHHRIASFESAEVAASDLQLVGVGSWLAGR